MSNVVKVLAVTMQTDLYSPGNVLHTVGAKRCWGRKRAPSTPKQSAKC